MKSIKAGKQGFPGFDDPELVGDRFRLRARIGHGRLGEIYAADEVGYRHPGSGQRAAIQLLSANLALDQDFVNKLRWGYALLRVNAHPNIVRFGEFERDNHNWYLVMELLEGASLRSLLNEATSLPLDEALPIMRAVGDALQFLHAKSMAHGRVTAQNVFVTYDYEIRLLDIVPLETPSLIPGDVTSGNPVDQYDVGDDVCALACLSYEMIAGRHPYDFHSPAEAREAGLKPARIDSLSQSQWRALCRGLSLEPGQRTISVAEFLHEFGVAGTERLHPAETETAVAEPIDESVQRPGSDDVPAAKSSARPLIRSPDADHFGSIDVTDHFSCPPEKANIAHTLRKRTGRARWPVIVLVFFGVWAWTYYGQPREDVAVLITALEPYLGTVWGEIASNETDVAAIDISPGVAREVSPATDRDNTATGIGEADDTREATTSLGSAVDQEGTATTSDATSKLRATVDEPNNSDATDVSGSSGSQPEVAFTESVILISEGDGAARITAQRRDSTAGSVVWWTGDQTALADEDYVPVAQPVAVFVSGENTEILHIPLINDSKPEPRETFYVYLGRLDSELGRLVPVSSIRVDIDDDEWR